MSENPVLEETIPNREDERGRMKLEQGKRAQQLKEEQNGERKDLQNKFSDFEENMENIDNYRFFLKFQVKKNFHKNLKKIV